MKSLSNLIKGSLLMTLISTSAWAQNGEQLFKAKCNVCHLVDKASTGPVLKGVKQKWEDAGESDLLVQWVQNSGTLIASGKSKMANEIKNFSASEMTAQDVSAEDVTAILDYIDNYVAPVETAAPPVTDPSEKTVTLVPNYKDNLRLFYWLVATIIILLFAIILMANSTLNLAKSDFFKKKLAEIQAEEEREKTKLELEAKENAKNANDATNGSGLTTTILAIIGLFTFIGASSQSYALTFFYAGENTENLPWLKVENSDVYFLVAINIILIAIVFYLRNMFNQVMSIIRKKEDVLEVEEPKAMAKLNKVLNDFVPIEEEHTILMQHEYDGIRELDNNLPPWWVWGFVATIIFAVIYLFNFHIFKTGDLQIEAYEKEMKQSEKEVKAYLSKMSMNVDETSATLMLDAADLDKGKALFQTNCVTCHNPKGEGNIGPNLTDAYWLYGADIKEVFKTVKTGTPNGMPEHNSKFNPIQIQQVSSYVLSLPETAGKEPQGEKVE